MTLTVSSHWAAWKEEQKAQRRHGSPTAPTVAQLLSGGAGLALRSVWLPFPPDPADSVRRKGWLCGGDDAHA